MPEKTDYSGPMTETTYTLDEVHAALAHDLVVDMAQHHEEATRDEREPDQAPDPYLGDMAIEARNEALDEYWAEYNAWAHERDMRQEYPYSWLG